MIQYKTKILQVFNLWFLNHSHKKYLRNKVEGKLITTINNRHLITFSKSGDGRTRPCMVQRYLGWSMLIQKHFTFSTEILQSADLFGGKTYYLVTFVINYKWTQDLINSQCSRCTCHRFWFLPTSDTWEEDRRCQIETRSSENTPIPECRVIIMQHTSHQFIR